MRYAKLRYCVRPRLPIAAVLALAGLLAGASPALADSQTSSNWSGYAVHGARFRDVGGEWRVPRVDCSSGNTTYSAMWLGLGGFSNSSSSLEQTGTEADCDGQKAVYSAWYELVPSPSHSLALRIHAGDLIRAEVRVSGRRVTLTLADLTRHRHFVRTFTPASVDTNSAEWILEAPGDCSGSSCITLPLADFGRAAFSHARVVTASGRSGAIAGPRWNTTRITLISSGRGFVDGGPPTLSGGASPGALTAAGAAFSLSYTGDAAMSYGTRTAAVASAALRH